MPFGGAGHHLNAALAKDGETDMATATQLGRAGLQGWREKVADGVSQPIARGTGVSEEHVRAVIGSVFFVLSVIYVGKTIATAVREARRA